MVRTPESAPIQTVRGRDAELTVLGQHLDRLLSGIGSVVLVEGGAGMGKTRLLGEVAAMARRLSIRFGGGVADPGDTVVQMSVLMEALFEGPSPILERSALGDAHASPEQRYWLLQDLEALLEGAALNDPLLICLDDVQWADSGTAAALRALPSRLTTLPIGWVIALRPAQGSPQVRGAAGLLGGPGSGQDHARSARPGRGCADRGGRLGGGTWTRVAENGRTAGGQPVSSCRAPFGTARGGARPRRLGSGRVGRMAPPSSCESEHARAARTNVRLSPSSGDGRRRPRKEVLPRRRRRHAQSVTIGAAGAG